MSYYQKPAILPYVLFLVTAAMLVGARHHRTQFWNIDTLVMIQTKFGFHWSSTFRGEDFWKSLIRTTDDDDGRQLMGIAHMTLWVGSGELKSIFLSTLTERDNSDLYCIKCIFIVGDCSWGICILLINCVCLYFCLPSFTKDLILIELWFAFEKSTT